MLFSHIRILFCGLVIFRVRMLLVCFLKPKQAEPQLGKDTAVMSGLLEILVILWKTVASSLQKNKEAQKYMCAKFGSAIAKYFKVFTVRRAAVCLSSSVSPLLEEDDAQSFPVNVLVFARGLSSSVLQPHVQNHLKRTKRTQGSQYKKTGTLDA